MHDSFEIPQGLLVARPEDAGGEPFPVDLFVGRGRVENAGTEAIFQGVHDGRIAQGGVAGGVAVEGGQLPTLRGAAR